MTDQDIAAARESAQRLIDANTRAYVDPGALAQARTILAMADEITKLRSGAVFDAKEIK